MGRGVGVGGHGRRGGLDASRCGSRSRSCAFRRPSGTPGASTPMRYIQRKNESAWLVLRAEERERPGIADGAPRRARRASCRAARVELLPYVVAAREFIEPRRRRSVQRRLARFGGAGVDLKYGLSSNLTLDATINPDFGQVEVDPAVVNLTAFETFFEEKRPFFIEGARSSATSGGAASNNFWGFNRVRADHLLFAPHRTVAAGLGATGEFVDSPVGDDDPRRGEADGKDAERLERRHARRGDGARDAQTSTAARLSTTEVEPLTNYFVGARAARDRPRGGDRPAGDGGEPRSARADAPRPRCRAARTSSAPTAHYFLDSQAGLGGHRAPCGQPRARQSEALSPAPAGAAALLPAAGCHAPRVRSRRRTRSAAGPAA